MKSDIVVVGGGASGLMAAYAAADFLVRSGSDAQVLVLEKMPRPARKIMISGKGRCNFTNLKDWNGFSSHVRANSNALRPAFYNLTPEALTEFFSAYGMRWVVERGDRAFPESHHASDVVDALVNACLSRGVKILCEQEVSSVERKDGGFSLKLAGGRKLRVPASDSGHRRPELPDHGFHRRRLPLGRRIRPQDSAHLPFADRAGAPGLQIVGGDTFRP